MPLNCIVLLKGENMKKNYRIKKNKEFQVILHNGKSFANRQFIVYYNTKPENENFRVGISVGKKIGKAHQRNKIKRYIREYFNIHKNNFPKNINLVVIARKQTAEMGLREFEASLDHIFTKLGFIKKLK